MEDKRTYEELVGYLGRVSPVLEGAEALAQNVMAQIEYIARHKTRCMSLRLTGRLSGAAACLLLCLLMHEAAQLTPARQDATKAAATLLARQAGQYTPDAEQSGASASAAIDKTKVAGAIKEKLSEYSRKEQRYAAYLSTRSKNTR